MNIEELKKVQSMTLDEINQIIEEAKEQKSEMTNLIYEIINGFQHKKKDITTTINDILDEKYSDFYEQICFRAMKYSVIGHERSYVAKDNNEPYEIQQACDNLIDLAYDCINAYYWIGSMITNN